MGICVHLAFVDQCLFLNHQYPLLSLTNGNLSKMSPLFILLLSLCVVSNVHYSQILHIAHHNLTFPDRPFLASPLNTIVINLSQLRKSTSFLSNCSSGSSKLPLLYLALLLLSTSKDIELNPGPVKYPCQICNKAVKWTTPGVCCDS